jgi:hypothetical protein
MTNAFEKLAERQICAPRKARMHAAEKRAATAAEKALAEREQMLRLWQGWRAERVGQLLEGAYGKAARDLLVFLGTMKLADAAALIALIKQGPWRTADPDTRFVVLALIDAAITTLRERAGLPSIDDALPGEPPTAFQIIRGLLS